MPSFIVTFDLQIYGNAWYRVPTTIGRFYVNSIKVKNMSVQSQSVAVLYLYRVLNYTDSGLFYCAFITNNFRKFRDSF